MWNAGPYDVYLIMILAFMRVSLCLRISHLYLVSDLFREFKSVCKWHGKNFGSKLKVGSAFEHLTVPSTYVWSLFTFMHYVYCRLLVLMTCYDVNKLPSPVQGSPCSGGCGRACVEWTLTLASQLPVAAGYCRRNKGRAKTWGWKDLQVMHDQKRSLVVIDGTGFP
jgi:hypothetical protein